MNFSFLKKIKTSNKIGLVFNVGGSSVSAVIANFHPENSPQILYAVRIPYKFKQTIDKDIVRDSLRTTLADVCNKIETEGLKKLATLPEGKRKISEIHAVLSSVWCVNQTKVLKLEKTLNFFPSEEISEKLKIENPEDVVPNSKDSVKMSFIEREVSRILLNGYELDDSFSKETKKASVYLSESATSQAISSIVKDEILKKFHTSRIKFHSFPFVLHSVLKETFSKEKNYLMVDIGSETTELMFVRDRVLMETVSFPIGRNHLIRRAPKGFNESPEILSSLISIHSEKANDSESKEKFEKFFNKIKTEWLVSFDESVQKFSHTMYLPKTVFLVCDQKYESVFSEWISEIKYSSFYQASEAFSVVLVKDKSFEMIYNIDKPDIDGEQFLALESIYVNSFINNK